jgi:hypothetical protein
VFSGAERVAEISMLYRWEVVMVVLVIVLLMLWVILAIVGFAIKGLLWLAIIGIVLFVGTAAIGAVRRRAVRRKV